MRSVSASGRTSRRTCPGPWRQAAPRAANVALPRLLGGALTESQSGSEMHLVVLSAPLGRHGARLSRRHVDGREKGG